MQQTTAGAFQRRVLASPAAVGLAREYVAGRLRGLGYQHVVEDASLVTSELVTNAVDASPSDALVIVHLRETPEGLVLAVWDEAYGRPRPAPMPRIDPENPASIPDDPGGWGLPIVEALTLKVWVEPARHGPGKWICALIAV